MVVLLLGCSVQIATAEEGYQFVTKWWGSPDGAFSVPSGVAIDSAGNVYVVEYGNQRVQKFISSGTFITMWGSYGFGKLDAPNGKFCNPWGIAVDSKGYVYVADTWNDRVQKFTSTGTFVTKWGGRGGEAGQFVSPQGIAVDSEGYVYVADAQNNRIQKFTSTGTFVAKWGVSGSENGQFHAPLGIAVDSVGYVYVADSNNRRIQKFASDGTFVTAWRPMNEGGYPFAIAVDNEGYVYISGGDPSSNWVQKFTSDGTFITTIGDGLFGGAGQFDTPRGIAIDGTGNVYVADTVHNLIQKFAPISPISTTSTFRFTPSPLTIKRGSTNTTTLYIDGLKNGISGFNVSLSLSLTDPTIGEIIGVSLPGWTMQQKSTLPADTVWLSAIDTAGISEPGASSAQIGTITIRGDRNGQTALSIIQARVDDDSGELTSPQFANCPVEVTGSGLYLSCIQSYPNDLNEDGRYEDINGNGHIDFNDVVLFFNNMDWIAANEPVSAFDFNRNGQIDFNDVVLLFNQI